jgi:hypothetical protein
MSSTESSGAPAEATATNPAPDAAFPSFGSTRGSGLARGKRPSTGPAATTAAAPSDYKPTAIEVLNAPREYVNPFAPANPEPAAPAEEPVAAAPAPAPAPVAVAPVAPVVSPAPVAPAAPEAEESARELNILPPAEQKSTPAQTWESEGFRPGRDNRSERPRREERAPAPAEASSDDSSDESVDTSTIPEKFLYVRPGVTYVPTPRNWGGAPRERRSNDDNSSRRTDTPRASAPEASAPAPAKSGGFVGWLKSLFGGSPAPEAAATETRSAEARRDGDGQRRHRGGRNRGGQGGQGGGEGGRGRGRGGRGRSGGGRDERGSSQGGV